MTGKLFIHKTERIWLKKRKNIWTGDFAYLNLFSDFIYASYTQPESYDKHKNADRRLRAGWSAGFHISPHNSQTLYFGSNYLAKSIDGVKTWKIISPDLTHDKKEWQVPNYEDPEKPEETV